MNKKEIDYLKNVYNSGEINKLKMGWQKSEKEFSKKFVNFKNYIHKFDFNKDLQLLNVFDFTDYVFNYRVCLSYIIEIIIDNDTKYAIWYEESLLLPYRVVNHSFNKNQEINNEDIIISKRQLSDNKFVLYVQNFNKSIAYIERDELKTKIPGVELELVEMEDVTLYNLLFEDI